MATVLALLLAPAGFFAFALGLYGFLKEKRFFKRAIKTTGKVVGALPAKYSQTTYGNANPNPAFAMMAGVKGKTTKFDAGAFLRVEFEADGYIYTVNSEKTFYEIEEPEVTVHYDPKAPAEAIIDGYYLGPSKYYQMAGGALLMAVPLLVKLLVG